MEIKGTAVKSIPDFIRKTHPEKYQALEALPESSQKLFKDGILPSNWYPMHDAAEVPTEVLGKLLYSNATQGAGSAAGTVPKIHSQGYINSLSRQRLPFSLSTRPARFSPPFTSPR